MEGAASFCIYTLKWQPSEFWNGSLFDMAVCLRQERNVQKRRNNSGNGLTRKKVLELEELMKKHQAIDQAENAP